MGHHYVPRFYLKNFAFNENKPKNEPQVFSMTKKGMIPDKPNAVSDICQKENYNTLEQESKQTQLENFHSIILEDFISDLNSGNFKLSRHLLEFISFMMGNNILIRGKIMKELNKRLKVRIESNTYNRTVPIDTGYRGKFDLSIVFAEKVYKELESWRFDPIGVADGIKFFITSDNPVSLFNPENVAIPPGIGVQFTVDEEKVPVAVDGMPDKMQFPITLNSVSLEADVVMFFPITPSYCILGFSDVERYDSYRSFMEGPDRNNNHLPILNILTYAMCNKAVYAHSFDLLRKVDADKHIFQDFCNSNGLIPSFDLVLGKKR